MNTRMVISGTALVKTTTTTNYHSLADGALITLTYYGSETVKLKFKQCHEWGRARAVLLLL